MEENQTLAIQLPTSPAYRPNLYDTSICHTEDVASIISLLVKARNHIQQASLRLTKKQLTNQAYLDHTCERRRTAATKTCYKQNTHRKCMLQKTELPRGCMSNVIFCLMILEKKFDGLRRSFSLPPWRSHVAVTGHDVPKCALHTNTNVYALISRSYVDSPFSPKFQQRYFSPHYITFLGQNAVFAVMMTKNTRCPENDPRFLIRYVHP